MEKLDKERYLKRVIVVCWIALAICFGIKLFGGNLFEIMCENENFIKVCNYADSHFLADYILSFTYCFISVYFGVLALCGMYKYTRTQLIIVTATILVGTFVKYFSGFWGLIFDVWQMIIMPCIFTIKNPKRHKFIILGNILLFVFQAISMFVKNLEIDIVTEYGLLIGIIYSIDVLIMTILYYLYSNVLSHKKEKNNG